MIGALQRIWRRARNDRGVAAIETAFLFPVFMMLILGGVEFAYQIVVRAQMENAVREASRIAVTGKGTCINGAKRADVIINSIKDNIGGVIKVGHMGYPNIAMQVIHTAASVGHDGEPDDPNSVNASGVATNFMDYNRNCIQELTAGQVSASGAGGPGDLVIYTVNFRTKFLMPFVANFVGTIDGIMYYQSKIMVRNEPWGSTIVSTPK
jgi:Flp pilus assembly protein TadG